MSIIVALDTQSDQQALSLADQLDPKLCRLKVVKELFTAYGPDVVKKLQDKGFEIFLDLKFHDIPNTTAQAVLAAARMGVWMVNVHAIGGRKMMETCADRLQKEGLETKLIAVTILTSMDAQDLNDLGLMSTEPLENVLRLARLSYDSGMDGIVCSAQEASFVRQNIKELFELVTPGIRPISSQVDDQKRICTPSQALALGATHLVIGRPITQAADPLCALQNILVDI